MTNFAKEAKIAIRYFWISSFDGLESGNDGTREQIRNWYSSRFFAALAASPISGTEFLAVLVLTDKDAKMPGAELIDNCDEVTPSAESILRQVDTDSSLAITAFKIEITRLQPSPE